MCLFMRLRGYRHLFPQQLTGFASITEQSELQSRQLIRVIAASAEAGSPRPTALLFRSHRISNWNTGNDIDFVFPDDGRTGTLSRNLNLPLHISCVAPGDRRTSRF